MKHSKFTEGTVRMLTAEEVVKSFPMLLKEHPEFRTGIYEIISDKFEIKSYAEESREGTDYA